MSSDAPRPPDPPSGEFAGQALERWRRETRRELGLPEDVPIAATGHQAALWHAGILAKDLLADRLAEAWGGRAAHLTVDQDTGGFDRLDVPVRTADGALTVRSIKLATARDAVPVEFHPPVPGVSLPPELTAALSSVAEGLKKIDEGLRAHAAAANAAVQFASVLAELRAPFVKEALAPLRASSLLDTTIGVALLDAMAADPQTCARAYNRAVHQVPEAGMTALLVRDDWVELPIWRLRDDQRRQRGYDDDIARWRAGDLSLRPRALLMTAIMRLGVCDLFIHGRGGAVYDRITELWIRDWLGLELAPTVVTSADVRLPLTEDGAAVVPAEIETFDVNAERLRHAARRAWHDPEPEERAHPSGPGPVKRDLLSAIAAAPRGSARRYRAYRAMHEQIAKLRSRHVGRVEHAQRRARESQRAAADARFALRRDWAFPLCPDAALHALRERSVTLARHAESRK